MIDTARKGAFEVSRALVMENPQLLFDIFQKIGFLPVQTDMDYMRDQIIYSGFCNEFAETKPCMVTPRYALLVIETEDGQPTSVSIKPCTD